MSTCVDARLYPKGGGSILSLEYAPDGEFEATVNTRMQLWKQAGNTEGPGLLEMLLEKKASVSPEVFAETLASIDANTGIDHYWDHGIPDPWLTTFGVVKKAAVRSADRQRRVRCQVGLLVRKKPRNPI